MSKNTGVAYVGIGGSVAALESASGREIWRQSLKGRGFVTLQVDGDMIYAGTAGEVFCLDRSTGHIRWHNPLKGLGTGFISFANTSAAVAAAAIAAAQAAATAASIST